MSIRPGHRSLRPPARAQRRRPRSIALSKRRSPATGRKPDGSWIVAQTNQAQRATKISTRNGWVNGRAVLWGREVASPWLGLQLPLPDRHAVFRPPIPSRGNPIAAHGPARLPSSPIATAIILSFANLARKASVCSSAAYEREDEVSVLVRQASSAGLRPRLFFPPDSSKRTAFEENMLRAIARVSSSRAPPRQKVINEKQTRTNKSLK